MASTSSTNDEILNPFIAVLKVLQGIGKYITQDVSQFTNLRKMVSDSYQVGVASPGEDYSKLEMQCAYIFIYFPIHSLLEQMSFEYVKRNFSDFTPRFMEYLISRDEINVCSVGGGPGTDIFGLAIVAEKESKFPKLKGTILEYHCNWQSLFGAFRQACPLFLKYVDDVSYVHYDFKDQNFNDKVRHEIEKADLVTMVKFLSEVYDGNDVLFQQQLKFIFTCMKEESKLLVIDNSRGDSKEHFRFVAKECLKCIFEDYTYFFVPDNYSDSKQTLENAFQDENPDRGFRGISKGGAWLYIGIWEKVSTSDTKEPKEDPVVSDESQPMEN